MRRSLSFVILGAAALAGALLLPSAGRAQDDRWGGDAYWGSLPGVYTPRGATSLSQNYVDSKIFMSSYVGPNWQLLLAIDHEERLEKFGTRYGPDHPPLFNRLLQRRHR
jgi:hypothetical protein